MMHACTTDARTLGMNDRLRDDDAMLQRGSPRGCAPERGYTRIFFACGRPVPVSPPFPRWFAGGVLKTDARVF